MIFLPAEPVDWTFAQLELLESQGIDLRRDMEARSDFTIHSFDKAKVKIFDGLPFLTEGKKMSQHIFRSPESLRRPIAFGLCPLSTIVRELLNIFN